MRRSYVTAAVFNATGGSNRTPVQEFVNWYDELECDVAIVSEVFRFASVLRRCGSLCVGMGEHGKEDAGVVVHRKVKRWSQRELTEFIERPGSDKPLLWHDRWATRVVAGGPMRRIVAVSSHAPAVIQYPKTGETLGNPGAREWVTNGLPALESILRRDMRENRPLLHGADGNMHENAADEYNPAAMYARLGMAYLTHEVMWLGWNPRRFELVRSEIQPTPPGSDGHPVLLATFRRIPRHRRKEKS